MACDDCQSQIFAIGEVCRSADAISTAKDFFDGPDYCTAPGAAKPEDCKTFVDSFVPKALPALGYSMELAKEALCKAVYNVC